MKSKKAMRIISVAANVALLVLSSAVSLVLAGTGHKFPPDDDLSIAVFSVITFFLLFLLFANEVISMLRIPESTYHTVLVAFFLLLYAGFSPDSCTFYTVIGLPCAEWVSESACELCFLGIILSTLYFFTYTYRPGGKRISLIPMLPVGAVCAAAYFILAIWRLHLIAHGLFTFSVVAYFIRLQTRCYRADADDLTFALSAAMLFSILGMHTVNMLYFTELIPDSKGWSSVCLWLSIFCFLAIYLSYVLRTAKTAQHAEKFRRQAEQLKTNMLFEQFKPHFVFNALTTVKSMYHRDLGEGDKALWLFSEYMRDSVGMLDAGLVPFEKELEFVTRYIDFCNVDKVQKFKVIFDIDSTDFSVPALSLQPYIENAVKYSKVNQKEDGYIMISSCSDRDGILLKIADNGVGFDVQSRKEGAHGMNNSADRFRILLGAETSVESDVGGTVITIRIPNKGGGKT